MSRRATRSARSPFRCNRALANAHSNGAVVAWDIFASAGPGLNGFTPAGIGIEEEALYDPVSAKYYIERAATQDGCAPQNVVIESCGLWNGSSIDRLRSVSGDAMPTTGVEASVDLLWNGTSYDRPRGVSGDAQGATGIPVKALMLWNGATYDRAYGDKTNGLFVNVKQLPALPAGSNVIGAVTQSGGPWSVSWSGQNVGISGTLPAFAATPTFNLGTAPTLTTQCAALNAVVTSVASSSLVMKGAPGNLMSLAVNSTGAGWLMLFDATSSPADGTVSPKWAYPIAAGGALNMAWLNPLAFTTGIIAVFSSTGPFTKAASATAFISGQVQ